MPWLLKPEWLIELESRRGHLPKQDLGIEFGPPLLEGQVKLDRGTSHQRSVQTVNCIVKQPRERVAASHGQVLELTQSLLVDFHCVRHATILRTPPQPVK
jgi:hypothetical protein